MAVMNMVSAGAVFGGKLSFKKMSAGGRLCTLQETPNFGSQRSKLDHLTVCIYRLITYANDRGTARRHRPNFDRATGRGDGTGEVANDAGLTTGTGDAGYVHRADRLRARRRLNYLQHRPLAEPARAERDDLLASSDAANDAHLRHLRK